MTQHLVFDDNIIETLTSDIILQPGDGIILDKHVFIVEKRVFDKDMSSVYLSGYTKKL